MAEPIDIVAQVVRSDATEIAREILEALAFHGWHLTEKPPQDLIEDFAHVAHLLRIYINKDNASFKATLSNNSNIILAALDMAAGWTEP